MTPLERELANALVEAEFWQRQGQHQRVNSGLVLALSHQLHQRADRGHATTVARSSSIWKP